jgi:hypothetical protein
MHKKVCLYGTFVSAYVTPTWGYMSTFVCHVTSAIDVTVFRCLVVFHRATSVACEVIVCHAATALRSAIVHRATMVIRIVIFGHAAMAIGSVIYSLTATGISGVCRAHGNNLYGYGG